MYCIWRRRPSCDARALVLGDRVEQRLGQRRGRRAARRGSATSASPSDCSSCDCLLAPRLARALQARQVVGARRPSATDRWIGADAHVASGAEEGRRYHSCRPCRPRRRRHTDRPTCLLLPVARADPASPTRASSSSSSSRTRWRIGQDARRERCRRRGLRRRRPVGVGAQGRDRERRAQPRQVDRRHGLHRPAARQCEHLRLLARRRSSRRCARPTTSPASPPRTRPPACPTTTTSRTATAADARPRPVPSLGDRRRGGDRARPPLRGRGARDRSRASPTPKAPACRRSSRTSSPATRAAFGGGYASSRHSLSVAPIASARGDDMQRDAWYTLDARRPTSWPRPEAVGRYAAERALSRLASRKIKTCEVPVLFESTLAAGLLGAYVQATSGGALYRKSSLPARQPRQARCCPTHIDIARGSAPAARQGQRAVRRRRRRARGRATSSTPASCRATSCRATRRASSACARPATPAARTT